MPSWLDEVNRAARRGPVARGGVALQVGRVAAEAEGNNLQVRLLEEDAEPVTIPALPGNYMLGGTVNVQWDTATDRPLLVYGPAEAGAAGDSREVVVVGGSLAGDREARAAVDVARDEIGKARAELDAASPLLDAIKSAESEGQVAQAIKDYLEITLTDLGPGDMVPDVVTDFWDKVVVARFLVATDKIITENVIADNAVTARALNVVSTAADGTSWRLDEDGFVASRADSQAALHMDHRGLRLWDTSGALTVSFDTATGQARLTGRYDSGRPGEAGVSIVPLTTASTFKDVGVFITRSTGELPGGSTAGMWVTDPGAAGSQTLNLRGDDGGGVTAHNGMHVAGNLTASSGTVVDVAVAGARMRLQSLGDWHVGKTDNNDLAPKVFSLDTNLYFKGGGGTLSLENMDGAVVVSQTIYNRTTTQAASVYVGTTGVLARSSSARRYKADIQDTPGDWAERVLELRPRTWYDQGEIDRATGDTPALRRIPGLVAEEVEDAGLDAYVTYGDDGQVEGLTYDRLWTLLIPVTRAHRDRITAIESRLAALEAL